MDNQIINCRCGRERRNEESNWSGLNKNTGTYKALRLDLVDISYLLKELRKNISC